MQTFWIWEWKTSQRPHPKRPSSLNKIQKEKFDPLYQCCVRNADKYFVDLGYAGTELLGILNKRNFQAPKYIIYQRLQIPHLLKPKPVPSPRLQTNLWSLNCTNICLHTAYTIYPPPQKRNFQEVAGIFPERYLYHTLFIWRTQESFCSPLWN